ncbi:hypothetical protein M0R45_026879 [Rubus argutus]|uniref:Uncharacterized protein n=1 Tax=Rubus argutus TaxID=59490 RepID=A0AAW1X0L1_RUBAR
MISFSARAESSRLEWISRQTQPPLPPPVACSIWFCGNGIGKAQAVMRLRLRVNSIGYPNQSPSVNVEKVPKPCSLISSETSPAFRLRRTSQRDNLSPFRSLRQTGLRNCKTQKHSQRLGLLTRVGVR